MADLEATSSATHAGATALRGRRVGYVEPDPRSLPPVVVRHAIALGALGVDLRIVRPQRRRWRAARAVRRLDLLVCEPGALHAGRALAASARVPLVVTSVPNDVDEFIAHLHPPRSAPDRPARRRTPPTARPELVSSGVGS